MPIYPNFPSVSPCNCQAKTDTVQTVLHCSQPGLPRSSDSVLLVFGRSPNAGLKSSEMVLTGVGMTKVTKERQADVRLLKKRPNLKEETAGKLVGEVAIKKS